MILLFPLRAPRRGADEDPRPAGRVGGAARAYPPVVFCGKKMRHVWMVKRARWGYHLPESKIPTAPPRP